MCFGKAADRSKKLLFPYFDFGWHIFMPNSVIFIASAKFNSSTALSTFKFFYCTQVDSCSGCYCIIRFSSPF